MEQKPDIRERKLEKSRLIGAMRSALQKIVREGFPEAASPQSTRAPADPPALDAQAARDSSPDTGLKLLTAVSSIHQKLLGCKSHFTAPAADFISKGALPD